MSEAKFTLPESVEAQRELIDELTKLAAVRALKAAGDRDMDTFSTEMKLLTMGVARAVAGLAVATGSPESVDIYISDLRNSVNRLTAEIALDAVRQQFGKGDDH